MGIGAPRIMKSKDCKKWHSCSAAHCPLPEDDRYPKPGTNVVYTQKGERTCLYVGEYFKEGAETNFEKAGVAWMYEYLKSQSPVLTKELERSAKTKSRIARFLPEDPSSE